MQSSTAPLHATFRFPLKGEGWQSRFLVGAGLTLAALFIPILPLVFVYGYIVEVMRRVIGGEEPALPAWDDWGRLGRDGLRAGLAGLLYLLPGLVVYCGGMGLYFAGTIALPLLIGSGGQDGGTALLPSLLLMVNVGGLLLSMALAILLFILGAIPLPLAVARLAAEDRLGAAFGVRQLWRILRANWVGFFIGWVIVAGLAYMLSLGLLVLYYSVALCCLVPLLLAPAGFYIQLVSAALFAQAYAEGAQSLADSGGVAAAA